jgi:hypothetical protein
LVIEGKKKNLCSNPIPCVFFGLFLLDLGWLVAWLMVHFDQSL